MSAFFVTGGTMKPDAASYVHRAADDELYNALLAGEYCSVLTTRQMGKSSLMARTAVRLEAEGTRCAIVDLQGKGEEKPAPEQWYYGVVKQIADSLQLPKDWPDWWNSQKALLPVQRMTDFFADVVLQKISGRVVVFIDEVDWMIRLPFSDEFFAAIRSCYNRRATDSKFERLSFVLLGSAAPAQLIKDSTRTPFNIGHSVELTDFTREEAQILAQPLGENGATILARIFYWTDGHPYLTQMLLAKAAERREQVTHGAPGSATGDREQEKNQRQVQRLTTNTEEDKRKEKKSITDELVDSIVQRELLSSHARQQENNLKFVADRLTKGRRKVLLVYRDILRGKKVQDVPTSVVHTSLRLAGAVKPNAERQLQVRNGVYASVFDSKWVKQAMPVDLRLLVAGSVTAASLAVAAFWYFVLFPKPYVQALEGAINDEQVVYNAYKALDKPFHHARANELLAQFWERREDRDAAILVRARAGDGIGLAELIGTDYSLLRSTFRHASAVNSVAFSPDGKFLATASANDAQLFEASTGRQIFRFLHPQAVYAAAFSPDSKLLAMASYDNTARIYETATGQEISRIVHESLIDTVSFSPSGDLVATGSWDKTARISETRTGRKLFHVVLKDSVEAVSFSPDGKLVAIGSSDKTARVLEVKTGRAMFNIAHQDSVTSVSFSPDGKLLATASNALRVFEVDTGRQLLPVSSSGGVNTLAFSPNGKMMATGGWDHTARVFDAATGSELSCFIHQGKINAVTFSPDGKLLATASDDQTARVFAIATKRQTACPNSVSPAAAAFSPDGKLVATTSEDKTARVFEVATGREMSRFASRGLVEPHVFSPNGNVISRVVTSEEHTSVRAFDATTGRPGPELADGAFSPNGKLVAQSDNSTVHVLETATGREISQFAQSNPAPRLAFSPDGTLLASLPRLLGGTEVLLFEVAAGQKLSTLAVPHREGVDRRGGLFTAVVFSPDGKLLAMGYLALGSHSFNATTAEVMDAATGREILHQEYQTPVASIVFSPDGRLLVMRTDNWLHLYGRDGEHWRPIANWHPLHPYHWGCTMHFLPAGARCSRCIGIFRGIQANVLALDKIDFDKHDLAPIQGKPEDWVKEWSQKLGLTFDSQGKIVPLDSGVR